MKEVIVSVPATTANLGAGFDCLGLALEMRNLVVFAEAGDGVEMEIEGEGAGSLPRDAGNLIVRSAQAVFEQCGRRPVGLRVRSVNKIPSGMGLGSSAASIVGGLAAANALVGGGLSLEGLLRLAHRIEGHPDNVAAALYGSLALVSADTDREHIRVLALPALTVVVAVPELRLSTAEARALLPRQVPLKDAVFNIGRALLTVQALTGGDFELLRHAMADRLHQPFRKALIPGYDTVEMRAREAGAAAVALSGAGPSLVAFAPERHTAIAEAMQAAFEAHGVRCRTLVVPVDHAGVQVTVSA